MSDTLKKYILDKRLESLETYKRDMTIEDIVDDIEGSGISYETYQRRCVWTKNQQSEYIKGIILGETMHEPLVFVDLDQLLKQTKDRKTMSHYVEINKTCGYESMDGQNRLKAILAFIRNNITVNLDGKDYTFEELDDFVKGLFENTMLTVVTIQNGTLSQLRDKFKIMNTTGVTLNDQEVHNSGGTKYHKEIKKIAKKNESWKAKYVYETGQGKFAYIRMGDYYIVNYYNSIITNNKVTKSDINKLYDGDRVDTITKLDTITKEVKKTLKVTKDLPSENKGNVNKSWITNLVILLNYMNTKKYNVTDYKKFFKWFYESESKRRNNPTPLNELGETYTVWCNGVSNSTKMSIKLEIILHDFYQATDIGVSNVDNKRTFTYKDLTEIYHNPKNENVKPKMVRINGCINGVWFNEKEKDITHIEVGLDTISNNRSDYPVDHIIPHSRGGKTDISNGEIVTKKYNEWKSNKVYDSMKESLVV